jgi:hypothetical protein
MRKNENQATAAGPNPDYVPQAIPGPKVHHDFSDIVVAYVNYLEERVVMFEREHNIESEQMNDVRNRNTELEIQNRELRKVIAEKGYRQLAMAGVHPWDMSVGASAKNPTGLTANQLVDHHSSRINELVTLLEQHALVQGVKVHPWDQVVGPSRENPLGYTANDLIKSLRMEHEASVRSVTWLREMYQASVDLSVNRFVQEVGNWSFDTFGEEVHYHAPERGARLLEEATETAQVAGVPEEMAHIIISDVYKKPIGNMNHELGGVIVCWGILISSLRLNGSDVMRAALKDCWDRQPLIREKQRMKMTKGTAFHFAEKQSYGAAPPAPDVVIAEGNDALKSFIDSTRWRHL